MGAEVDAEKALRRSQRENRRERRFWQREIPQISILLKLLLDTDLYQPDVYISYLAKPSWKILITIVNIIAR